MGKEGLIIKIGTDTLVRNGKFDSKYASDVAQQIADIRVAGVNTVLVSSGAVALGEHLLGSDASRVEMAAAGQKVLQSGWEQSFAKNGLSAKEILVAEGQLTLAHRKIARSLQEGHVPVINGDDSANPQKFFSGEAITHNNDIVAKWLALNLQAGLLLLSNVEGVLTEERKLQSQVAHSDEVIIFDTISAHGTGGMKTKVQAGIAVAQSGNRAGIANGRRPNVIRDFASGKSVGTTFIRA